MIRPLRPRATSAIAVAPATVSDRTAPLVLGLEPRAYRELVAREGIPHALLGRRLVARVEDVLVALDRLAARGAAGDGDAPPGDVVEEAEPTADELLARVGRRRAS